MKIGMVAVLLVCTGLLSGEARGMDTSIAEVKAVEVAAGQGRNATVVPENGGIRVTFTTAEWPNVFWEAPKGNPWDWSDADLLAIDLTNTGDKPLEVNLRIDDSADADGVRHTQSAHTTVAAGVSTTLLMSLHGDEAMSKYGMRGAPPLGSLLSPHTRAGENAGSRVETQSMETYGSADRSHLYAMQIFLHRPATPQTLTIRSLRLIKAGDGLYEGIVDRFGQFTRADWPGKLHDASELATRRTQEQADLDAHPTLAGRDAYGGWADGPKVKATGFFRTEQRDGRWWLVTPEGHLFLSLGVDTMQSGEATVVEKREALFTWLPPADDPLAKHFSTVNNIFMGPIKSGRVFDFYGANLERKYGPDTLTPWRRTTLARLKSWGFNTIGNWSDDGLAALHQVPYVATLGIGGDFARVSSGGDYWGKMPDPFDPKFASAATARLAEAAARKDDPWLLGYFVDNELSWAGWSEDGRYGLAYGTLAAEASQPAKQAFLAQLTAKYGAIEKLNAAWGATFASWNDLRQPYHAPKAPNAALRADMAAFLEAFALRYFTVVRDTLRHYDPNHLYLGCRFAAFAPEEAQAAAKVCDVVSFNIYATHLDRAKWGLTDTLGKPCLIGEFHFGALDRGMFHPGLVRAANQQERAELYKSYLHSVFSYPAFVGAHWFQYTDEPLTGRSFDGENYNIGFVDVTDTPYPEMVAAARSVHAEAYQLHASATASH